MIIGGNYKQSAKGVLELNIASKNDLLKIKKTATLSGKLRLNFTNKYVPVNGETIMTFDKRSGAFSSVETLL